MKTNLAKTLLFCMSLFVLSGLATGARAGLAEDVRATYLRFSEAQNARDPARIGTFFADGPELLWVSDGKSIWGREAVLARMSGFQKSEFWKVKPDLAAATVIELGPLTALLHMPLTLAIGSAENPARLRFLVSIVFVQQTEGWRIAALLTTTEKP